MSMPLNLRLNGFRSRSNGSIKPQWGPPPGCSASWRRRRRTRTSSLYDFIGSSTVLMASLVSASSSLQTALGSFSPSIFTYHAYRPEELPLDVIKFNRYFCRFFGVLGIDRNLQMFVGVQDSQGRARGGVWRQTTRPIRLFFAHLDHYLTLWYIFLAGSI